VPSGAAYYRVYPERHAPWPAPRPFAQWLDAEATTTRARLSACIDTNKLKI
jgi:LysR family transcriptional regulator, glycine cleavage system transcriptional activator